MGGQDEEGKKSGERAHRDRRRAENDRDECERRAESFVSAHARIYIADEHGSGPAQGRVRALPIL